MTSLTQPLFTHVRRYAGDPILSLMESLQADNVEHVARAIAAVME